MYKTRVLTVKSYSEYFNELPLLLKSSTNTISLSIDGGDLFRTLLTVLISVDHPSL
jgi:hypothetical protein